MRYKISPNSRKKVGKLLKRAWKSRWLSFKSSIVAIFEDSFPVLSVANSKQTRVWCNSVWSVKEDEQGAVT